MKLHGWRALVRTSFVAWAWIFMVEGIATADPSTSDKAAAEALFVGARKLLGEGKYAEACKSLAESQRLDPGVGTLLNLGRCYEKLGRTASAWSTYREAAAAARGAHQPAREKNARIAAEALEKKVPMLTITVTRSEATPDIEVRRNGTVVAPSLWGLAVAVDPGEHTFEAAAPHSKPWRTQAMAEPGKTLTINIPALEPDGWASKPSKIARPNNNGPAPVPETPKESTSKDSNFGAQRIVGLILGGAGIGAAALGGNYALRAKSTYSGAECVGKYCTPHGLDQRNDAEAKARTSTILVAGGLVTLAAGVVLWVTAPTSGDASHALAPKPRIWVAADPFGAGEGGVRSVVLTGVFQ